jgi:hypothetical protein
MVAYCWLFLNDLHTHTHTHTHIDTLYTVAQLVEALSYKSKSAALIPDELMESFSDLILPAALWP